jgi:hypothetical protein
LRLLSQASAGGFGACRGTLSQMQDQSPFPVAREILYPEPEPTLKMALDHKILLLAGREETQSISEME